MDLVTFTAIVTLSTGKPHIWRSRVPAERCEQGSAEFRRERPGSVAWCRSELRPRRISDELPKAEPVEYLPDGMDGLGMPGQRRAPGMGR